MLMNTTAALLIPHGLIALLIGIVGFLIKHELHDVKSRIVRIENYILFGHKEEDHV